MAGERQRPYTLKQRQPPLTDAVLPDAVLSDAALPELAHFRPALSGAALPDPNFPNDTSSDDTCSPFSTPPCPTPQPVAAVPDAVCNLLQQPPTHPPHIHGIFSLSAGMFCALSACACSTV